MEHIRTIILDVEFEKGTTIGVAFQEAVRLAAKEWRNVRFTFNDRAFNDREYSVNINDLMMQVQPEIT